MFGTLLEPIILLFFVYWYWNRLDISADAIIKYFASGFFLCTSSVFVYEVLASIGASVFVFLYSFLGLVILSVTGETDLTDISIDEGDVTGINIISGDTADNTDVNASEEEFYEGLDVPQSFVITIAIITSFLHAFLVASLIEELLKYLCFWMVEHPDLGNDVSLVPIPKSQQPPTEGSDLPPNEDMELLPPRSPEEGGANYISTDGSSLESQEDSMQKVTMAMARSKPHPVSFESRGSAITVAMVTVAIGFACAENFLYVFIYTEGNIVEEVTTLIIRALFPVHPLCAAIQSIFVVRRDVEKDNSVGVGRILFVAWLLHGAFDFLLMAYEAVMKILEGGVGSTSSENLIDSASGDADTTPDEAIENVESEWIVLVCSLLIPVIGFEYYLYQAKHQTKRLQDLDSGRVSSSQITNPTEVI